jgi:sec-independent protein translocase protein TatC
MSTAASAEPTKDAQAGAMPLTGHLTELRNRLVWSIIAIAVGSLVGFAFGPQIIAVLKAPIPSNIPLIVTQIGSAFSIRLQVAIVAGVILAMPVLLWHVWRFVSPGLTQSERRAILPWIPLALAFFAIGVTIAYVIMPFAAQFLFSFVTPDLTPLLDIRSYFDFLTTLFLAFGILMEFPILLVGLSRVGIVTSARLTRSRRMIILIIAIFSAVATPGGDLVSPTVLGVTLYVLFEGTVFFIRRTGR